MKMKIGLVMAVACLLLAVPGAALAQSPTADGYSGIAGQQTGGNNGSPDDGVEVSAAAVGVESTPAEAATAGSTLPFTGLEVGAIVLAGICLLGGGVVLYRMSRGSQQLG